MTLVGVIGIYVGMIFQEVKRRPVYILRNAPNGDVLESNYAQSAGGQGSG